MAQQKGKTFRRFFLSALAIFAVYAAADLFWPFNNDFRQFDPVALGKLETDMWRSYYDRKPFKLFFELTEMLRTQYKFPWLRSYLGAYYATKAAFVFKDGKQRSDYEKALPALESYFTAIHRTGDIDFDIKNAAKLELAWWIVHRERESFGKEALDKACADAAAAIYLVSPDSTLEHGRLRADAMVIRDVQATAGGVREDDWAQIDNLLQGCYRSLKRVVQ
ncbi:MAG: hypothetical protein ONB46_00285 [candidate division KSB1 bacterium]|nr:hypothetical protein [candidate division KSB1 bacterium]MDZ7364719.1 hypothetical protein [candidate division KSB1 bacterium]MDZ7402533.1 hypothetical protein [candidate division KSB1 bacterium]